MPTRRAWITTGAPPATISSATTSSTQRVSTSPPPSLPGVLIASLLGDEAGFLHQRLVLAFGLRHPVGVLLAGHERVVEGAFLRVLLPFGELSHLLEHLDEVIDLLLCDAGGHEDAAQHQVLNVEALRLAGRNFLPRLRRRHLRGIGHRSVVEHAQWPQRPRTP